MIELRATDDSKFLQLLLDGQPVELTAARVGVIVPGRRSTLSVFDASIREALFVQAVSDLPEEVEKLHVRWQFDGVPFSGSFTRIWRKPDFDWEYSELFYSLAFDYTNWKRPWSPREYVAEVWQQLTTFGGGGMGLPHDFEERVTLAITLPVPKQESTIGDSFTPWVAPITDILTRAVAALDARLHEDAISMRFDFPPQVQGACEQYLTYFAQFLRELGIEATTDLQHEETTVLFSVTPKEKEQALEQIWRALALYLQLPTSPVLDLAAARSNDIRVQQLAGMVQYYNAQLTLGRAAARSAEIDLRAQAREIQALEREVEVLEQESASKQLMIAEHRALLEQQGRALESANVLLDSLRSVSKGGEVVEKEEFLGGIVAFGTMEEKGVSINWARGIQAFKRLISGKREGDGGEPS